MRLALDLGIAVSLAMIGAATFWEWTYGYFGIYLAFGTVLYRIDLTRKNAYALVRECEVEASADTLLVDGERVPRGAIVDGWFQPRLPIRRWFEKRPLGSTVRLLDRKKRILLEVEVVDQEQSKRLLEALGLSASHNRAEFRGPSWVTSTPDRMTLLAVATGILIVLIVIALAAYPQMSREATSLLGQFAIVFGIGLMAVSAALPSTITVGVDGVEVRWFWWRRFIPMTRIAAGYAEDGANIRLALTDGTFETIATARAHSTGDLVNDRRHLILARINDAWAAARGADSGTNAASLIARGTQSVAQWMEALATLDPNREGYRQTSLREDDLWRALEDAKEDPEARAAAAYLLRKRLDARGKERIRVVAQATALPKLRIALEAATGESDEEAAEALQELVAPEPG